MSAKRKAEDAFVSSKMASSPDDSAKRPRTASEKVKPVKDPRGNVRIALGETEDEDFILNRQYLSGVSAYFLQFDDSEWPERFRLVPDDDARNCKVVPDVVMSDQQDAQPKVLKKFVNYDTVIYARKLNIILFQMLYRKPVDFAKEAGKYPVSQLLLDITHLAQSYGCCQHIKGDVLAVLFTTSDQNKKWFGTREGPLNALQVAYVLQDRTAFIKALRHAAGHRAAFDKDWITLSQLADLPELLHTIVNESANEILEKVRKACFRLALPTNSSVNIGYYQAWSIFHHHLINNVLSTLPADVATYRELYYILHMRSGSDLIATNQAITTMDSITSINTALASAVDHLDCDYDNDDENARETLRELRQAAKEDLNERKVINVLGRIMNDVKPIIQPLYSGDKNAEYFTCVDCGKPMPWETVGTSEE